MPPPDSQPSNPLTSWPPTQSQTSSPLHLWTPSNLQDFSPAVYTPSTRARMSSWGPLPESQTSFGRRITPLPRSFPSFTPSSASTPFTAPTPSTAPIPSIAPISIYGAHSHLRCTSSSTAPIPSMASNPSTAPILSIASTPSTVPTPSMAPYSPIGDTQDLSTRHSTPDETLRRGPSRLTNRRADAIPWSDEATRQLLILLNDLQGQYGNNGNGFKLSVWTQVCNLLKEKGYLRTAKQAQNKFTMTKARWKDREYLKKPLWFRYRCYNEAYYGCRPMYNGQVSNYCPSKLRGPFCT